MKSASSKSSVCLINLGCKLNIFEGDAILESLKGAGHNILSDIELADVVIVNSCTVTAKADDKSRKYMRRAKKYGKKVIATGCYATTDVEALAALDYVDLLVSNRQKFKIHEYISFLDSTNKVVQGAESTSFPPVFGFERTRAFLKIQDGCNQFCSFCKIPFARGASVSQDIFKIQESLKMLLSRSYKEIVLTGINIGDYSFNDKGLGFLVQSLLEIEGDYRIRLSSLLPNQFDLELINCLAIPKMAPHFHLSVQSGSNTVLKRMRRQYVREDVLELVSKIRSVRDDTAITADIIVGFPGETEEEFLDTISFVKELELSRVHIFPYSSRPGTRAAQLEDLSAKIKRDREKFLHQVAADTAVHFVRKYCLGKSYMVLAEEGQGNLKEGYTENYLRVQLEAEIVNNFYPVFLKRVSLGKDQNPLIFV